MYTSTAKQTQNGGYLEMQKNTAYNWCHIQTQPSVHKYSKASSKTKIEQTITYNRTFNIIGCIKYDRPNYDLAIYLGTKNKVIRKPVTYDILMHRTFYVVFFTSYAWGQTRITQGRFPLPFLTTVLWASHPPLSLKNLEPSCIN